MSSFFNFFPSLSNQNLGQWGENEVAGIYQKKGYKILDRNYFNRRGKRLGEVDLIAVKGRELVFIEVKTRISKAFGTAAEAVNRWKQQRLVAACKFFLVNNPKFTEFENRIDVVELNTNLDRTQKSVKIIENAVEDVW